MGLFDGTKVRLRNLSPIDTDTLLVWENNPSVCLVSDRHYPVSRQTIIDFINQHADGDICRDGQLRLMIESLSDGKTIGTVDLFDFDEYNRRAAVGILIYDNRDRHKGYATEALSMAMNYATSVLHIEQLYCDIFTDNIPSIHLFERAGFVKVGIKSKWIRDGKEWRDVFFLQRIF